MSSTTTPRKYATGTKVSVDKTQEDLRKLLRARGADQIMFHDDFTRGYSVMAFQLRGAVYLTYLPMPDANQFTLSPSGRQREPSAIQSEVEKEKARLQRCLHLLIKAKLTAIDEGITTEEKEFFSDRVIWNQDGQQQTVYEWYAPQVEHLKREGLQPPILPAVAEPKLLGGRRTFQAAIEKGQS